MPTWDWRRLRSFGSEGSAALERHSNILDFMDGPPSRLSFNDQSPESLLFGFTDRNYLASSFSLPPYRQRVSASAVRQTTHTSS